MKALGACAEWTVAAGFRQSDSAPRIPYIYKPRTQPRQPHLGTSVRHTILPSALWRRNESLRATQERLSIHLRAMREACNDSISSLYPLAQRVKGDVCSGQDPFVLPF